MKKELILLLLCMVLLSACKKDNNQPATATPQQLATVNTNLSGTWAVAGIPTATLGSYSGSVFFDGQSVVKFTDYTNTQTQQSYTLSGNADQYTLSIASPALTRNIKILKITADTLKIQSNIIATNSPAGYTINEVFVKAQPADVSGKLFKIFFTQYGSGASYYPLNINTKIYVTHLGGTEQLVDSRTNVNLAFTYSFTPAIGDHIRIAVINTASPGNTAVFTCLATYKGVPFGSDWQSAAASSLPAKSWDVSN